MKGQRVAIEPRPKRVLSSSASCRNKGLPRVGAGGPGGGLGR